MHYILTDLDDNLLNQEPVRLSAERNSYIEVFDDKCPDTMLNKVALLKNHKHSVNGPQNSCIVSLIPSWPHGCCIRLLQNAQGVLLVWKSFDLEMIS
jgi:hypothetical protein